MNGQYLNVFISTETPGKLEVVENSLDEIHRGMDMFTSLLHYWQRSNKYDSTFCSN